MYLYIFIYVCEKRMKKVTFLTRGNYLFEFCAQKLSQNFSQNGFLTIAFTLMWRKKNPLKLGIKKIN